MGLAVVEASIHDPSERMVLRLRIFRTDTFGKAIPMLTRCCHKFTRYALALYSAQFMDRILLTRMSGEGRLSYRASFPHTSP